ncbi:MAG: cell division protein FtsZ [Candidatus Marinimicrobia bacterium]|nr:cell division protein FtsZ [Candidatus Neomarinimicrobiota bacterium]|tara:strand:+ start:1550 stop:2746 length:1197 start_codon:yes stop_codon:yes gene_type:complete
MLFEPGNLADQKARIVVIGVGGGGGNALNRMIEDSMSSVEFIAINTDAQDLENNNSQIKLQIGKELTKGLGAGANSEIGQQAVEENREIIINAIESADMVFITAGMGGGTGTGAAPAIAKIAKELDALTVGIVTKPFRFEGPQRMKRAMVGIEEMEKNCDTLLAIPNEILLKITDLDTTVKQSFKLADRVLHQATKGISDLINRPGLINLDFADVKTTMKNMGGAIMGTGIAKGQEKAILAAQEAINSPLLQDASIKGAKGLLVNITGPEDMTMHELNAASNIIYEEAGEEANVILGCILDNQITDEIQVTVIATGLNKNTKNTHLEPNRYSNDDTVLQPRFKPQNTTQGSPINTNIENENNSDNKKESYNSSNDQVVNEVLKDDLDIPTFMRNRNIS